MILGVVLVCVSLLPVLWLAAWAFSLILGEPLGSCYICADAVKLLENRWWILLVGLVAYLVGYGATLYLLLVRFSIRPLVLSLLFITIAASLATLMVWPLLEKDPMGIVLPVVLAMGPLIGAIILADRLHPVRTTLDAIEASARKKRRILLQVRDWAGSYAAWDKRVMDNITRLDIRINRLEDEVTKARRAVKKSWLPPTGNLGTGNSFLRTPNEATNLPERARDLQKDVNELLRDCISQVAAQITNLRRQNVTGDQVQVPSDLMQLYQKFAPTSN